MHQPHDPLHALTDALLDSYADCGGINHIDGINLPSKDAVAALTNEFLHLLFPGFYAGRPICGKEMPGLVLDTLRDLRPKLVDEIGKSLDFAPVAGLDAETVADWFLGQLVPVRHVLQTDVAAAFAGDPAAAGTEEVILSYPGIEAIAVYRLANLLYRKKIALLPRMMTEWAHSRTGIDIHPGATIGPSFFIDHGTGVVIGETCVIGANVKIYHGVTLGARSTYGGQTLRGHKRHPTIEDDVTVYPGATILGGDTVIGARAVIGGNVWLLTSVPPDNTVTMEEQQLRYRSRAKEAAPTPTWEI
ncbi:MAG TPA: serine O-acetyltransferase EpsC [Candidatus Methylacidiphilales bacterium]